jgi:EAL domain-containing protein (putative c-di-GMP-specific phosphodiesterase class I)
LHKKGFDIGRIAINLSDKQLKDASLLHMIANITNISGCSSSLIEFEVTEGFVMRNIESSIALLRGFQDMGFVVSMDDFGTGYSSLSYLKKLPLNVIKIDKSFIDDIPGIEVDEAIVNTIIELGRGLNLQVIAEGVEKVEQTKFLLEKGCYIIQGYLYSKPIAQEEVEEFIKNFNITEEKS